MVLKANQVQQMVSTIVITVINSKKKKKRIGFEMPVIHLMNSNPNRISHDSLFSFPSVSGFTSYLDLRAPDPNEHTENHRPPNFSGKRV